jgi:hypothetical protein
MKRLAISVLAVAVLAVPATASAKTIRQKGGIVGDQPAKVTLQVKLNGKDPKAVANFKAKNIATRCNGQPARIDFFVLDAVPVKDNNGFKVRLTDGEGGILRISGKVKNDGKRVVGNLKTNAFDSSNGQTCKTPKQRFKTSK